MLDKNSVLKVSDDVVMRTVAGTTILVPLSGDIGDENDRMFSLDEVGADIFSRIDGEKTVGDIVNELSGVYSASFDAMMGDVIDFLALLCAKKIIFEVNHA